MSFLATLTSGQAVFKGALGWNDWLWWVVIGSLVLFILLLLVCCCVCVQRAKRKGREEALATVQTPQRRTQAHEASEQRYQPAQQTNGPTHSYQPPSTNYSQPATAIPMVPPPPRKIMGPQVAANGYREDQFAKPYPPLPAQQVDRPLEHQRQYPVPLNRYNGPKGSPSGRDHEATSVSSSSVRTSSHYPNNLRYDSPYAAREARPVTSPSSNQPKGTGTQNGQMAASTPSNHVPAPSVASRSVPRPSGATLQARIDALRSADSQDMVHSRISFEESDVVSTFPTPRTVATQESYASGSARRSNLLLGSYLSPNSTAMTSSRFTSPSNSLQSSRSYESYDPNTFNSAKSPEHGDGDLHDSTRSYRSDISHSQYEDDGPRPPDDRPARNRAALATPRRQRKSRSRGSFEF